MPWDLGKEFLIGTVRYKTKSLGGTKPNTNSYTNPNPNTDPKLGLTGGHVDWRLRDGAQKSIKQIWLV